MKLVFLVSVTMTAFAANSVLNRMAVGSAAIDPASFAVIRVAAGALMLACLAWSRLRIFAPGRAIGATSLAVYMIGFSLAYLTLDAGLGALILFGTVQVSMFGWQALREARPTARALLGAGVAFAGLLLALWPQPGAEIGFAGSALMLVAGLGWAAYTLNGRGVKDPLAETGANFVVALPLTALLLFVGRGIEASAYGILLAVLSGAITSGLGYALWYSVLPRIAAQTAAVVQLSVPIIAIAGGAILLSEPIPSRLIGAAVLVLGGIALAVTSSRSTPAGRR